MTKAVTATTRHTPAEERAYRSGAVAFRRGKSRGSNPHHCATVAASDKYWAWYRGYDEASKMIKAP